MSILDLFTKESLLKQVITEIDQMFEKDKKMFKAVADYLFDGKKVDLDILKEDRELNVFEIKIRKKIFEHLSINPKKGLAFSLIIIDVARDTERVGDYCKNIYKMTQDFGPLVKKSKYWQELKEVKEYITDLIEKVHQAFKESNQELANSAISEYREKVNQKVEELKRKVGHDNSLDSKEVAVLVLTARYFRRTTAHLINIATSVVNEFPKIRYTRNYGDV